MSKNRYLATVTGMLMLVSFTASATDSYAPAEYKPKVEYTKQHSESGVAVAETADTPATDASEMASTNQTEVTKIKAKVPPSTSNRQHTSATPTASTEETVKSQNASWTPSRSMMMLVVLLTVAGIFFFRKKTSAIQATPSENATYAADSVAATGVERYLEKLSPKKTGVAKYLEKQLEVAPVTGVAKYLAKQAVSDRAQK